MRTVNRVLVADDHQLVREGICSMLHDASDFLVVAQASNGREAVKLAHQFQPDLVLMDIQMPQLDGIAATRQIKTRLPGTGVVLLTMHESLDYLLEAVRAGASGYLLKDSSRSDLLATLRKVAEGDNLLDSAIMRRLTQRLATLESERTPSAALSPQLTLRETEVLVLLADGLTNPEIAARLVVSIDTVKTHVRHIIEKLNVSDRTQAAVVAVRMGLVRPK